MQEAQRVTRALGGDWHGDYGLAPGPGHSPKDRSLSIRPRDDGEGLVFHSFAGDDWKHIKDDLRARGLINDGFEACQDTGLGLPSGAVAQYVYRDADGKPVMRVVRKADKGFYQQRWNGSGWARGVKGVKRVPYHLPDILNSVDKPVIVCEGEKDADRLKSLGLIATTNPGGAGKWPQSFAEWFVDRCVLIVPDNDDTGRQHADQVASSLADSADSVKVCPLSGLSEKGDVSNWLDQHGDDADALFDALNAAAVHYGAVSNASIFNWAELESRVFEPLRWIIPGILPEGLTLLGGKPKIGKSWMALAAALAVATGGSFLGAQACERGDVLYLALEDSERRLQERTGKIIDGEWPSELSGAIAWRPIGQGCEDDIRKWAESASNPRLVVVDVLAKVRNDAGKAEYQGDYKIMEGLQRLAQELRIAIVVVHHLRKAEAADPLDMINGTSGLTGAVDATIVLSNDPETGLKTLYGRGREVEEFELALEFDDGRWSLLGDATDVRTSKQRRDILNVLKAHEGAMGPKEIAEALGLQRSDAIRQMLSKMVSDGEIIKLGRGEYVHRDHHVLAKKYGEHLANM